MNKAWSLRVVVPLHGVEDDAHLLADWPALDDASCLCMPAVCAYNISRDMSWTLHFAQWSDDIVSKRVCLTLLRVQSCASTSIPAAFVFDYLRVETMPWKPNPQVWHKGKSMRNAECPQFCVE